MSWPLVKHQVSLAGSQQLFSAAAHQSGEGSSVPTWPTCFSRDRRTDETEPDRLDESIENRHAQSNPEVAVWTRIDPTVIGNRNVTFWSKWWREIRPDPKIRQDEFGTRHHAG